MCVRIKMPQQVQLTVQPARGVSEAKGDVAFVFAMVSAASCCLPPSSPAFFAA